METELLFLSKRPFFPLFCSFYTIHHLRKTYIIHGIFRGADSRGEQKREHVISKNVANFIQKDVTVLLKMLRLFSQTARNALTIPA